MKASKTGRTNSIQKTPWYLRILGFKKYRIKERLMYYGEDYTDYTYTDKEEYHESK